LAAWQVKHLSELLDGEGHVKRAAAADNVNSLDPAASLFEKSISLSIRSISQFD
jgi:hypothetical protein